MQHNTNIKPPLTFKDYKNGLIVAIPIILLIGGFFGVRYYLQANTPVNPVIAKTAFVEPTGEAIHKTEVSVDLNDKSLPRTSGPHNPQAYAFKTFSKVPIPEDQAVHSMEHGGIVIYYQENLPQDQKDKLEKLSTTGAFVVAPKANLEKPVIALSWSRSLEQDTLNTDEIYNFHKAWKNKSPEKLAY